MLFYVQLTGGLYIFYVSPFMFHFSFHCIWKGGGCYNKKKEFVYKTTSSWKIKGKIFTFVITERKNTEKTWLRKFVVILIQI